MEKRNDWNIDDIVMDKTLKRFFRIIGEKETNSGTSYNLCPINDNYSYFNYWEWKLTLDKYYTNLGNNKGVKILWSE